VVTGQEAAAARAHAVASSVADPELPVLTIADLGILRDVRVTDTGAVIVSVTPTYAACPAMAEIRADLVTRLRQAGYREVTVRTVLQPPWTSDWITEAGRRRLAEHGIAPPGARPARAPGPVPLNLAAPPRAVTCPACGSTGTTRLSQFGATACRALHRCLSCREPFEHVKEI
jgi:ring-1,2-phenylacetyl-CoA epoxidase subunit PaaD